MCWLSVLCAKRFLGQCTPDATKISLKAHFLEVNLQYENLNLRIMKIKEKVITTLSILLLGFISVSAEEVYLSHNKDMSQNKDNEIPIRVDFDQFDKQLRIDFKKSEDYTIMVSGPDGLVLNGLINTESCQRVRLDLKPYEEGDYEIVFYDNAGTIVDGSFYLKK